MSENKVVSGRRKAGKKKAQSAAELGSISNTIVGTGNLALTDAQSQTIPSGIEIEEVLVESGDQVKKEIPLQQSARLLC